VAERLGRVVPYVDENLNPLTGEWLARAKKLRKAGFYDRGAHYNHSGYADLVITGLARGSAALNIGRGGRLFGRDRTSD
jgi:hypothetical protein